MNPSDVDDLVLEVVRAIPPSRLASYGDVAHVVTLLGTACTPRRVARTLGLYGGGVPWWRVVQAGGTVAQEVLPEARSRLAGEQVVINGRRVPLDALRWRPDIDALRARLVAGDPDATMDPWT